MESSMNLGGQEMQLLAQMKELAFRGWSPVLICRIGSAISRVAQESNLEIKHAQLRNAVDLKSILKVYRVLKEVKARAIILHSGHDAHIGALAAKLYRNFGQVKVIRMRTYQPGIPKAFPYNYLFDKTYTPSFFLRERILVNKAINPTKITVMYPGINFKKICQDSNEELPSRIDIWIKSHPGPLIVHGAMLRGEKGHNFFLNVFKRLLVKWPNLRYIIAGEGPEKDLIIKKINNLDICENVLIAGLVNPIAPLIKISTLAVLPSLREPLGMFQIESQFLKIPTIVSDIDGIPETIIHKKTGLLVKPTENEWYEAINWSLSNLSELQKYGEAGREFVEDKFSISKNIDKLISDI
jgi:glycosyltransferase involved in cell wall biosynthesis